MTSLAAQPAFVAFVVSLIVLSLNLLLLWAYSGAVRGKTKTTPNQVDSSSVSKGAKLVETEPPEVARVMRAYKNAEANILPFLFLAFAYVLAGGSALVAEVVFGVFTGARVLHSFAYLGGRQPWRSMFYGLGALTTLVLMGFLVKALVGAA
jgi:uncharacterized MAPEG superfamily protein